MGAVVTSAALSLRANIIILRAICTNTCEWSMNERLLFECFLCTHQCRLANFELTKLRLGTKSSPFSCCLEWICEIEFFCDFWRWKLGIPKIGNLCSCTRSASQHWCAQYTVHILLNSTNNKNGKHLQFTNNRPLLLSDVPCFPCKCFFYANSYKHSS